MEEFDVAVIGGGPGGYSAAIKCAQLGLKSACIEYRGALGGTCLNVGCIPSKAWLESSEVFAKISKHGSDYGVEVESVKADIDKMLKRKNKIVSKFAKGIEGLFKKYGVTYYVAKGSFHSESEISLSTGETIRAKKTIIATGSEPIEIPIAKFDGKHIVSSTEALDFTTVPVRLVVIGGGVIGLELGSVWARLGSKVTVLEAAPKLLGTMDSAISRTMSKVLKTQGIDILVGTKMTACKVTGEGVVEVLAENSKGDSATFEADKVLVCVGRSPYTKDLNLEKAGLSVDERGRIPINKHWQTSNPNIYAVGDVVVGPMLAHKAEEEGIAVAENIAGKHGHVNYDAIPGVIYTWPEVASVGKTEEECRAESIPIKTGQFPFAANGRAACNGTTDGFVKIIAHGETDKILGAHIVGPSASELIAELAVAVEFGASAEDIGRSVHAHPTLAEVIKEAALAVHNQAIHI